jgi:hypothetical protein
MSNQFLLRFKLISRRAIPRKLTAKLFYFNKPFGVRHWMEHVLGFPHADDKDAIIILIDPDMILLKPITRFFDNSTDRWRHDGLTKVTHGHPVAQQYLLSPMRPGFSGT